jgi:hypothetical protein
MKNKKIILPAYFYDIAMDILKEHGFEEKQKQTMKEMNDSSDNKEKFDFLFEKIPVRILINVCRKSASDNLSDKDKIDIVSRGLETSPDKAKKIVQDLEKKFIPYIKVIEQEKEAEEVKEVLEKETVVQEKIIKSGSDPYKEIIE